MRVVLALVALILLLVLILAGVYLAFPEIAFGVAAREAGSRGIEIERLVVERPGAARLVVREVAARAGRFSLVARDGEIGFELTRLLDGRLDDVRFAEVSMRVDEASTSGDETGSSLPAMDMAAVFAALPFKRLTLADVTLAVPEVGFRGEGTVDVDGTGARVRLAGLAPEEAAGLALAATLEPSGAVNVDIAERDAAAPFLSVTSRLRADQLELSGHVDLAGYPLTLTAALAGAPAGQGRLRGDFTTSVPWPPESQDLRSLDVSGTFSLDWRGGTPPVVLEGMAGDVRMAAGAVQTRFSGGRVEYTDDGLKVTALIPSGLEAKLEGQRVSVSNGLRATLSDASYSADATLGPAVVSLRGPLALTAEADVSGSAAGFESRGRLDVEAEYAGPLVTGTGTLTVGGIDAPFSFRHDLRAGHGLLESSSTFSVLRPLAANLFRSWKAPYDLEKGEVGYQLSLGWASGAAPHGALNASLENVRARYGEDRVDGIDGVIRMDLSAGGVGVRPSKLTAQRFDPGVALKDLEATVGYQDDVVAVDGAAFSLLGGRAEVAPFRYDLAAERADIIVRFEDIELAQVLALQGGNVRGEGRLEGELPLHVRGGALSVTGGTIASMAPGGTLKLAPSVGTATGQPGLDFALEALTDYRFTSLESTVDYAEDGELKLGVSLKGSNPKVEKGRPIHYNLNVTQNLFDLVRSLRADRTVTEKLERRVTQ